MHMHRFRPCLSLRSLSIFKSKCLHHHVHGGEVQSSTNLTTKVTGAEFMGPVAESCTRSMQMQIVKALCSGERRKASDLLLEFGYRSNSLTADDFVDILKYCERSPDPLFVMEIWRLMESKDIRMNNTSLSLMMQALCKGGYLEEAFNMMDFLGESQHLYPVLHPFNELLRYCTKTQNIIQARKCLDLMEKQIVGKSEVTYTEFLKLAVLQKNLHAVHLIWQEYIKHYSMNIISLRKFIWSFTRMGDLKSAYKTLQQMVLLAVRENISIARAVNGKLYSTRFDIPIPSNKELGSTIFNLNKDNKPDSCIHPPLLYSLDAVLTSIDQQIIHLGNKIANSTEINALNGEKHSLLMKVLRWSFNDIIHGCAKQKNYKLARKLILEMQNIGLQPSRFTYDGIVRAAASQSYGDAMGMFKKMQQKDLKPYDSTLATLSATCSRALKLDLAEAFLNQISECLNPHPYNALLESCDALNQPERAVQVFAKMKLKKNLPNIRTYELLFSLFGLVNAPYEESNMVSQVDVAKRINAIEKDMAKNGIQHSYLSMRTILKILGEERMIRELMEYLLIAENLFIHRSPSLGTDMYNVVLHYLVEAKESDLAIEIFKKMKLCGCRPDDVTYSIMIDCCSVLRSYKSASLLMSMMIREGFRPVICTYSSLIKVLLEDENFSEALNLLERVRLDGIQLDVLLFNTFLRKACYKRRIDVIEFIVEYMRREKIQPDPETCNYVFSAYVKSGFYNTAMEALQILSLRMMSEDGNILERNERIVDKFILAEDFAAESNILKLFEDSKYKLAAGLFNLRWCAILGFPVSESADQSRWAKRLELQFKRS